MTIRAILFDLDNTLIPEDSATQAALLAACAYAQVGYGIDPQALSQSVRYHARQIWHTALTYPYCAAIGISAAEGLCAHFLGADPHLTALRAWAPAYRRAVWTGALADHGVNDAHCAEHLAATFVQERHARYVVFPDVEDTLLALRSQYALALVTNGAPDLQETKFRNAGLAQYFDVVMISGAVGIGKPEPQIFALTLERLAVAPTMAVMVGDNLVRDIRGAQQAGLKGIWINRAGASGDPGIVPDACITRLPELHTVLPAWDKGATPSHRPEQRI